MRKIILLLLLQCSLAAVGQEKPKIFFSNKTIDLGIIPSEKTPCVSVNFIFSKRSIYNRLLLNILYVINQKYGLNL